MGVCWCGVVDCHTLTAVLRGNNDDADGTEEDDDDDDDEEEEAGRLGLSLIPCEDDGKEWLLSRPLPRPLPATPSSSQSWLLLLDCSSARRS